MVMIGWAQLSRAISALIMLSITIFAISAWSPTTSIFVCFLIGISGTIQLTLAVYGLNSILLLLKAIFTRDNKARVQPMRSFSGEWPFVTVQLPIYNERYVIQRLLEHCIQIDYPHDRLEIQVLDDSTDGTSDIVKAHVDELRKRTNIKIVHITRHSRSNFKAGALVLGTSQARGEYLAIFDADFTPDSDFLKQTIPHFSDEKVGCVQCRWGHLNDDHSLITKLQAIGHDGHFVIEQFAKCKSGFTLNFNGTAGVWRRQCIIDAGDWSGDTLAEDLDLSYRAQLKGWRIEYLRHVEVKAEVPLSISAFKKQQARWAKGSIQTAMKLLPRVWDSTLLTNMQKVQATIHLCGYSVHPMMLFNLCATCCLFFLSTSSAVDHIMPIVILAAVGPPAEVAYAQLWLGRPSYILLMPLLILLHHGLCLSNSSAVIEAFQGVTGSFERTPKFGTLQNDARWAATSYARPLRALAMPLGEIMMALLLAGVIALSFMGDFNVNYYTYPWLIFFLAGYLMIITFHVQENSEVDRAEKKRVSAVDDSNAEEVTPSAARDRKRK